MRITSATLLFLIYLTLGFEITMANSDDRDIQKVDASFIKFYQKLESEKNRFFYLKPITISLYSWILKDPMADQLVFNSKAQLNFKILNKLDYKTELFPNSTGVLTVTLFRNENNQYFIRTTGGCISYRDTLYGPFKYINNEFVWPKELEDTSLSKANANSAIDTPQNLASESKYFNNALSAIVTKNIEQLKSAVAQQNDIIFQVNNQGLSLLLYATSLNHTPSAEYLILQGSNVNQKNKEDMTPLMFAILNKNTLLIKMLIDKKADPNFKNKSGYSSHDYAKLMNITI